MPGTFSPASLYLRSGGLMARELSIFCDESGSDALDCPYYLLSLVFHDQSLDIADSITRYENALVAKGLSNIPFHASPLMYGKDAYHGLDLETRKRLLSSFRVFFRYLPISYRCLAVSTKEHPTAKDIESAMRRELVDFLFDHLSGLQTFDLIKIYYDNGQRSIVQAVHKAIDYALSKEAIAYRVADPVSYRLSQAADYICTLELTALKYQEHRITSTDEKVFGSWAMFKKGPLKECRRKLL